VEKETKQVELNKKSLYAIKNRPTTRKYLVVGPLSTTIQVQNSDSKVDSKHVCQQWKNVEFARQFLGV